MSTRLAKCMFNILNVLQYANSIAPNTRLNSTSAITNPLDENQQRIVDRKEGAKRRLKTNARLHAQRQYILKPRSVEDAPQRGRWPILIRIGHWAGDHYARGHCCANGITPAVLGTNHNDPRSLQDTACSASTECIRFSFEMVIPFLWSRMK